MVAARSRYTRKHPDTDLSQLVIYTTSQTHSLGAKAALVLGLSVRALDVKFEDELALTGESLRAAFEEDTAAGRRPFILSTCSAIEVAVSSPEQLLLLVATLGTTSSGAIDRLQELFSVSAYRYHSSVDSLMTSEHTIAQAYDPFWVHVDAAWAGVALSCPEYRDRGQLLHINSQAHSFCTNFHKV